MEENEQLRIASIELHDVFGIKDIKFSPGSVTRISARNGEGKSSIINGIARIFSGGCDPSMIRRWRCEASAHFVQTDEGPVWQENPECHTCVGRGYHQAPKSVVSMRLSNGVVITKTTAIQKPRKGADPSAPIKYTDNLEIIDADEVPINAPKSYVDELSAHMAVDPSTLLKIDASSIPGKRELAAHLLKLMPISFDPEAIRTAVSFRSSVDVPFGEPDVVALQALPAAPQDLDGLKKVTLAVTEMRRRIGQTKIDSDGTVTRLKKAIPEGTPEDHSGKLHSLEQQQVKTEKIVADERVIIEKDHAKVLSVALAAQKDTDAAADGEYQKELARITKVRDDKKAASLAAYNAKKTEATAARQKELDRLDEEARPERNRLAEEITIVKQDISAYEKAITLREELAIQEKVLRDSHWKYDRLSDCLTALEKLRLDALQSLPVDGLVVEDGQPYLDGIEWQNTNLSRRIEAVLQICTRLSGKLSFVLLDDCEHLSTLVREGLEAGLAAAGFQLIECVVNDQPLSIEVVK